MNLSRNIILSLKDHFEEDLTSAGYDFTFTSSWYEDDKIVLPKDYTPDSGLIKLPAGKITLLNETIGKPFEIGGKGRYFIYYGNVFIHAETEGQLYDILDLFIDSLTKSDGGAYGNLYIDVYDFSQTGYPSNSAPVLSYIEIKSVRKTTAMDLSQENVALKFGGMVGFSFTLLKG